MSLLECRVQATCFDSASFPFHTQLAIRFGTLPQVQIEAVGFAISWATSERIEALQL